MEATVTQIIGIGLSVGIPLAGGVVGVLKWSICRNIAAMDKKITELDEKVDRLFQRQEDLRQLAMPRADCAACRTECNNRLAQYQRETLEWLRRQDDKLDRLVMMVANQFNGQGGIQNGLPKPPGAPHE